jgi:hypothetical protein
MPVENRKGEGVGIRRTDSQLSFTLQEAGRDV